MSISASSKIAEQTVAPVAETVSPSTDFSAGFLSTFEAQASEKQAKTEHQKEKSSSKENKLGSETDSFEEIKEPEIFKLLYNYFFKDFLRLVLSNDDAHLKKIVREIRQRRGVSSAQPLSDGHNQSNRHLTKISSQYLNANWLMEGEPGMSFCGTL